MSSPDLDAALEPDPLGFQLGETPVEDALLELEVGDAVAQEAARPCGALEHRHRVTRAGELLGRADPRGPAADDRHRAPRRPPRGPRRDPALGPAALDDGELDLPDRHRRRVDRQRARGLAGRRADPARHLGQVVGHLEAQQRLAPLSPVDEVVPLGDQVRHRAAHRVAPGHAAFHAAGALLAQLALGERDAELHPRRETLPDRAVPAFLPLEFQEPRRPAHQWWTSSVIAMASVSRVASLRMRSRARR